MAFAERDHAVEALVLNRAHEALRVGFASRSRARISSPPTSGPTCARRDLLNTRVRPSCGTLRQHDDLEFCRRSRPEPKADHLEDTLEHDVAKGNHGTSSKTAENDAGILRRPD